MSFGKMKLPDVPILLTEKTVPIFSDIPALKLGRFLHFTGEAAEITATIFPVKHHLRRFFPVQRRWSWYFSSWEPLTSLFFQLSAVNATIFPVQRR